MKASFKLESIEDFKNGFLSYLRNPDLIKLLAFKPKEIRAEFGMLQHEEVVDSEIPMISETLVNYFYEFFKTIHMTSFLEETLEFVMKSKIDNAHSDTEFSESRVKKRIIELVTILQRSFSHRIEFEFFFKTLHINFDLNVGDFRQVLFSLGRAVIRAQAQAEIDRKKKAEDDARKAKEEEAKRLAEVQAQAQIPVSPQAQQ